ncbi:uncharacterized protein LOC143637163 isoform X2 [Bidens hawaiensis]|uniref:uncharacterized protein LOC143637154 n=1 Tax=Bidens hawaiensis TaxID=980011 RepID=UPI00404A9490
MKRKRAVGRPKRETTTAKDKLQNDVMNDEAGAPETNMSRPSFGKSLPNERTDATATSLIEKYPAALREMIVSIIKEISQEHGGLASLSTSLVDNNPVSHGQVAQPHADMALEGHKSPLHRNIEYNHQELNAAQSVIIKTMRLDAADPFNRPVDPVALEIPDYFDVIDTPMDFGTIFNNIENGVKYMNAADVFKDVQYIWYNCIKYNKKGDYILELMNRVQAFFMKHWIAAGLDTEQSASFVEPSPVTPIAGKIQPNQVAEDYPMPVHMLVGPPQPSSSQLESSPEQDEPTADSTNIQKKRHRGPTRCLKVFNTVGRIKIVTNDLGQPIGPEAPLLTSFLGLTTRDGNLAPLTFPTWSKVPEENKEKMWQKVLTKFDVDPCCRNWVLMSLGTKWRNFKALLKSTRYDTHETDEERLADCDKRVLPDQWSFLVSHWSSEQWQHISAKNKANRAKQKFIHTSGKKSFARIREEEKAKRPDGKEPSKAELFILTRTRKNGQPLNEETAAVISQLRESETNKEQTPVNKNKPEDEVLNRVIGVNRRGSVGLLGLNATSSRAWSETPTRAQALRMVSEKNAEVVEMKEKLASMEETCSQMAAQMSAMMSMMADMHKDSNKHNESEPISIYNHDGPSKQTRGRKKRA